MKHVVLVAGMDYEFHGVDFRVFCRSRMQRAVVANRAHEDLTFMIFDIRAGEVATHEITYLRGKRTEKVTKLSPSPFTALSKANFDEFTSGGEKHYRLKDGQRGLLSILDVYRAVRKIGTDAPGTLTELSIFSHGYYGGPILVNSTDDGFAASPVPGRAPARLAAAERDPDDYDARLKDLGAPTMGVVELAEFVAAFALDGRVWLWGCAFPRITHEILYKIEHHASYRPRGLADSTRFRFRNLNDEQADYLVRIVSDVVGPIASKRDFELEFGALRLFACRMVAAGYAQQFAWRTGLTTYAALMGTYAEYDKGARPLMHVHAGFAGHLAFYRNYLGFDLDPEGRKYGKHVPGFACSP